MDDAELDRGVWTMDDGDPVRFRHTMLLLGRMNMCSISIIPQDRRTIESFVVELVSFREVLMLPPFEQNEHAFYLYYITACPSL
jgi:hypothetical protein